MRNESKEERDFLKNSKTESEEGVLGGREWRRGGKKTIGSRREMQEKGLILENLSNRY